MRIEETKKIRKTMGLTQTEFAKILDVTKTTVCNWETGVYEPSPEAIKKLITFCKENKIRITR